MGLFFLICEYFLSKDLVMGDRIKTRLGKTAYSYVTKYGYRNLVKISLGFESFRKQALLKILTINSLHLVKELIVRCSTVQIHNMRLSIYILPNRNRCAALNDRALSAVRARVCVRSAVRVPLRGSQSGSAIAPHPCGPQPPSYINGMTRSVTTSEGANACTQFEKVTALAEASNKLEL